jgi:hypothetical protein
VMFDQVSGGATTKTVDSGEPRRVRLGGAAASDVLASSGGWVGVRVRRGVGRVEEGLCVVCSWYW